MTTYRERLSAPVSWWFGAASFALAWGWIMLVATSWTIAIAALLVTAALSFAAVWRYGSVTIEVDDDRLTVGRATIDRQHVRDVEQLGRPDYRRRLGPEADARAFLVTRPYLDRGVLVRITDHRDPTPYWLLSSRRPEALAAALGQTVSVPTTADDTIGEASRVEED